MLEQIYLAFCNFRIKEYTLKLLQPLTIKKLNSKVNKIKEETR